jgi:hypothetical protein
MSETMGDTVIWAWTALFLMGAYHGINPGMGWLFAVALGMQERSRKAVWRSLVPIAAGHALAIGAVVLLAGMIQTVIPLRVLKVIVAVILFALGLILMLRHRHPHWGGMQIGVRDLTFWSFLMASAHGAGLMVLPVLFGISTAQAAEANSTHVHSSHMLGHGWTWINVSGVAVHTAGYLLVTGVVAWVVYEKLGLALLRKSWLNLDLIWTFALMATGLFVLIA